MQLLKKIKQFHRENRKYNGFLQMEAYGCVTLIILVCNICAASTNVVDWFILFFWMMCVSLYAEQWTGHKKFQKFAYLMKQLMDSDHERCEAEHRWLLLANRRRKTAERKLKQTRKALRDESATRLGFEFDYYELKQQLKNNTNDNRK